MFIKLTGELRRFILLSVCVRVPHHTWSGLATTTRRANGSDSRTITLVFPVASKNLIAALERLAEIDDSPILKLEASSILVDPFSRIATSAKE